MLDPFHDLVKKRIEEAGRGRGKCEEVAKCKWNSSEQGERESSMFTIQ